MDESTAVLRSRFRERFGCEPAVLVRAPGRVNLIGEHTDYNGLPVLPFAIGQAHRLAAAEGEKPLIEIANDDAQYAPRTIALDDLGVFSRAGKWDNYLRAALLGLMDAGLLGRDRPARGLRILVSSDLPAGVGLSSSSALVVGFALAALHLYRIKFDRLHLAEVLAEAEHYVGTRGGGMDQTVCLWGQEGHVLRINFFPLEVEPISFGRTGCQPVPLIFLSDSGVRVEKSGAGLARYNLRPAECQVALKVFKGWHGHPAREKSWAKDPSHWGDLVKPPLALSHETVLRMIREALDRPSYSMADVGQLLGTREAERDSLAIHPAFKLRQRIEHVIAEARRVDQAVEALRQANWPRLAELIAASHASCRDLYEISCPELERLVAAASEAGALASRLTGAGFGGCVLHLVRRTDADRFESAMKRQLGESLKMWRVAPSPGAEVL